MAIEAKIWLYGTRAVKTKKTLTRIADSDIAKARGFHLFIKKSPRSSWVRVTEEIEIIPSAFRSKADKLIFLDSFVDTIFEELSPKPKPKKPAKPPKAKPVKAEEPIELVEERKPAPELRLPELPREPRVTLTKSQFKAQMSRILFDELDLENMKWSGNRIDSFIDKMWNSFKHAPHLIASEQFRRSLVSKELKRIRDRKLKIKPGQMDELYNEKLKKRDVTIDPEIGGEVKVVFKEAFNAERMKGTDDMTITTLENGLIVEKPRQTAFAQVSVEYEKMIAVSKESLLASDEIATRALNKTRSDIEKIFNESMEKGLFKASDMPEYSIRLLVPLVNGKGDIPTDYYAKKGKKRTGHGYSTIREKIKTKKDLKRVLDDLFSGARQALARYIKLNRSSGFLISGFTIERLLR